MKRYILFLFILLITSCSKEEIVNNTENSNVEIIYGNDTKVPQTIYNTSTLNHEDNNGWATFLTQKIESEFWTAFAYFDYNSDGEYDVFFREWGTDNLGVNIKTKNGWELVTGVIDKQTNIGYRKIVPADIDNDGDIDMICFIAEDPAATNNNRIMGGIDLYRFDEGIFYYESIERYTEGMIHYNHGGVVGDVNNDGWVDIIGSGNSGAKIYLNNQGTISSDYFEVTEIKQYQPKGGTTTSALELIDLNNDGYLDLLMGVVHNNFFFEQSPQSEHGNFNRTDYIYFGKSEYPYFEDEYILLESESNPPTDMSPATYDWTFIDFNKDGNLDILSLKIDVPGNIIEYYSNNGDGTFTLDNSIFQNESNYYEDMGMNRQSRFIKSWDIDGDGVEEILEEASDWFGFNAWKVDSSGKYKKVKISY